MEISDPMRFASVIVLLLSLQTCHSQTVATCKLGGCIGALSCPVVRPALSLYTANSSKEVIEIIKQHRCGEIESRSVCCTDLAVDLVRNNILANFTDENSTLALAELMAKPCGFSEQSHRIITGVAADLFEFPWMALLEYNTTGGRQFLCGGSLISDRYVLTAAHCLTSQDSRLVNVRLGEYDTSKEIDCETDGRVEECAPPAQNHQVEDVVIHQDFRSGQFLNDIALIRLRHKVVYGHRIGPICLPIMKNLIGEIDHGEVAGWGLTDSGTTSNVLQKAFLSVLSNDSCAKLFARNFTSSQICAGGTEGMDSCKGDSGGPFFAADNTRALYRFVQYGILSGGGVVCGGNNTVPSIYTNVVEYVPWIVKNMKF